MQGGQQEAAGGIGKEGQEGEEGMEGSAQQLLWGRGKAEGEAEGNRSDTPLRLAQWRTHPDHSDGEEEVPVDSVLRHVLLVVCGLHAGQPHQPQSQQRKHSSPGGQQPPHIPTGQGSRPGQ